MTRHCTAFIASKITSVSTVRIDTLELPSMITYFRKITTLVVGVNMQQLYIPGRISQEVFITSTS